MYVDILAQAAISGQGFLLGAALGLVYDVMRTVRRSLRLAWLAFLLDLLFWLSAIVSLFLLTLLLDDGQVRIYHGIAILLGGGGYFLTLSHLILPILFRISQGLQMIWRVCTTPIRCGGHAAKKKYKKQILSTYLKFVFFKVQAFLLLR